MRRLAYPLLYKITFEEVRDVARYNRSWGLEAFLEGLDRSNNWLLPFELPARQSYCNDCISKGILLASSGICAPSVGL